jgi:hypothetical protein
VTGENLIRHRATKFAHLSLKHISLIGVVRLKVKNKKKRKKVEKSRRPEIEEGGGGGDSARQFLFDQAAVDEAADDDEDDEDDDDDDDDDDRDIDYADNGDYHDEDRNGERGMSESELDSDSEDEVATEQGDLTEMLVNRAEANAAVNLRNDEGDDDDDDDDDEDNLRRVLRLAQEDHTYSCSQTIGGGLSSIVPPGTGSRKRKRGKKIKISSKEWRKKAHYRYSFLYAMVSSGVTKKIKNCIPKAVAILSNSKTIILGHVNLLLECLDPRLAELCYMDTDSCIFSFTHHRLEDNLWPEKLQKWQEENILANEEGEESCHGKLKLEGTFKVGFFKALKIYRLFSSREFREEQKKKICYTRCKGVNRNIAKIIPNKVFDKDAVEKVVVHRSCLRPSRTGEMLIAHECKSLAAPFNLKRQVSSDGIHTFPVSYLADKAIDGDGSDDDDEEEVDNDNLGNGSSQEPL